MPIIIPKICESCGKEFVRRGRAKRCEECQPPGTSAPRGKREPVGTSRSTDLQNATEFLQGVMVMAGMAVMPMDKHDAAVIMHSATTIPPQVHRVMQQQTAVGDALVNMAKKGAVYQLCGVIMLTMALPILAHHHIVPKMFAGFEMSEDAVDSTITATMHQVAEAQKTAEDVMEQDGAPTSEPEHSVPAFLLDAERVA